MFILQRYKYYILNQKKSEKKFHGIAKKIENNPCRCKPHWQIALKSVDAFQKQPPLIYAEQLHVED